MTILNTSNICFLINRRIKTMDFNEETAVREYIDGETWDDMFVPNESDTKNIANILGVNDTCIADILGLNGEEE